MFRNLESLETEFKNDICYNLGTMLYLNTQKSDEAINKVKFKKYIECTEYWIRINTKAKKGYGQIFSNKTFFSDIWLSVFDKVE